MTRVKHKKTRITFITPWYPNYHNKLTGIFIKEHAEALAAYDEVNVIACIEKDGLGILQTESYVYNEKGVHTTIVYYHKITGEFASMTSVVNSILRGILFFIACLKGFKQYSASNGMPDLINANITLPSGLVALFIKIVHGIPYITIEHLSSPLREVLGYGKVSVIEKLATKIINFQASQRIVPSRAMGEALKTLGMAEDYSVIHPCVKSTCSIKVTMDKPLNGIKPFRFVHMSVLDDSKKIYLA